MSTVTKPLTIRYNVGDTYSVAGLPADFTDDFEDLLLAYIFAEWSITEPRKGATMQDTASSLRFRAGFPDGFKPYEVNTLATSTTISQRTDPQSWNFLTTVEVRLTVKRIARDNIDPQLGNMEREVQRIINQYHSNEITGIQDLIYVSSNRDYRGIQTTAATTTAGTWSLSKWSSVTNVNLSYHKTSTI